jgi:hypothetical protein
MTKNSKKRSKTFYYNFENGYFVAKNKPTKKKKSIFSNLINIMDYVSIIF